MTRILIHVSSPEQADFFHRIHKALPEEYKATFITNNMLTYIYTFLKLNKRVVILNKFLIKDKGNISKNNVFDYFYTYLIKNDNWDLFFIWNGSLNSQKAIRKFATEREKKILYFEISNIDNKLFVDTEGVNKESSLFKDINKLYQFNVTDFEYNNWKQKYITDRLDNKYKLQQTAVFDRKFYFIKILKYIFNKLERFFGFVTDFNYDFKTYYKSYFNRDKINYDIQNNIFSDYIFFPLQVSNDTQIVYNSNVTVIEALKKIFYISKSENLDLVIKLHPAEQNREILREILKFTQDNDIKISNKDTFELITNAKKIITINSTVGLESLILEKDTYFLGDSFYKYLNKDILKNYINGYLIDVDYFSKSNITNKNINKILERIE